MYITDEKLARIELSIELQKKVLEKIGIAQKAIGRFEGKKFTKKVSNYILEQKFEIDGFATKGGFNFRFDGMDIIADLRRCYRISDNNYVLDDFSILSITPHITNVIENGYMNEEYKIIGKKWVYTIEEQKENNLKRIHDTEIALQSAEEKIKKFNELKKQADEIKRSINPTIQNIFEEYLDYRVSNYTIK